MPSTHIPSGAVAQGASAARRALPRFIEWILFWAYLPRNYNALVEAYGEMVRQDLEELKRFRYLSARLKYYEDHVPWLTDLRKKFDAENAGITDLTGLQDGVLIPANGEKRRRIIELTS